MNADTMVAILTVVIVALSVRLLVEHRATRKALVDGFRIGSAAAVCNAEQFARHLHRVGETDTAASIMMWVLLARGGVAGLDGAPSGTEES